MMLTLEATTRDLGFTVIGRLHIQNLTPEANPATYRIERFDGTGQKIGEATVTHDRDDGAWVLASAALEAERSPGQG